MWKLIGKARALPDGSNASHKSYHNVIRKMSEMTGKISVTAAQNARGRFTESYVTVALWQAIAPAACLICDLAKCLG